MRGAGSKLEEDVKERLARQRPVRPAPLCRSGVGAGPPLSTKTATVFDDKSGPTAVEGVGDQPDRFQSIALSTCHHGEASLEPS